MDYLWKKKLSNWIYILYENCKRRYENINTIIHAIFLMKENQYCKKLKHTMKTQFISLLYTFYNNILHTQYLFSK